MLSPGISGVCSDALRMKQHILGLIHAGFFVEGGRLYVKNKYAKQVESLL
jgi:hypothetical protein